MYRVQNVGGRDRFPAVCAVFLLLILAACLGAAPADEGKRVALIIGNDAYSIRPLQNAVNDARAMEKALREAGFRTILKENATKATMEEATAELLDAVGPGDTVLFFYAGHAIQIQNENVLIPVDFESARSLIQAKLKSFSLATVFDYLKQSRAKKSIVVIDACRSNPVREQYSLQGGLAIPANAGKESYIAFSTSPNAVATDNPDGKNSWFTEALSNQIRNPGLTIDEVFTRVRQHVEKATGGAQTPWSQTSLTARFYFHPPKGEEAQTEAGLIDKWFEDAERHEQRGNWPEALDLLNRVAARQPAGSLQQKAQERLPYVTARNDAASRYAARDFPAAAKSCEQALRLDPFATDAAFEGVNSYLLSDQVPQAVALLQAIRARGLSDSAARATAVLKELAAVSPEAAQGLNSGLPEPPHVKELFAGMRLDLPDWDAGRRYSGTSSLELTRWAKEISPAVESPATAQTQPQPATTPAVESAAQPAAPAEAPASAVSSAAESVLPAAETVETAAATSEGLITLDSFHLEVVPLAGARDLVMEKDETSAQHQFGTLVLRASKSDTAVVLGSKQLARQLPARIRVPVGKYEIRAVDQGKKVSAREVEVLPDSILVLTFN